MEFYCEHKAPVHTPDQHVQVEEVRAQNVNIMPHLGVKTWLVEHVVRICENVIVKEICIFLAPKRTYLEIFVLRCVMDFFF